MVLLLAAILSAWHQQQAAPAVTALPDEAARHLELRVEPQYPRIAEVARIQGLVRLRVTIGVSGVVERTEIIEPGVFLDAAAVEGVRQWRFLPFVRDGAPARVTTEIELLFPRARGVAGGVMSEYEARTVECRTLLLSSKAADAIAPCDAAVAAAERMPGDAQLERLVAYQRGGEARLNGGKGAAAVPYFTSELAIRERLQMSVARTWWDLARAYAAVPDLRQTKRAYEKAESAHKFARDNQENAAKKNDAAKRLQTLLIELVEWFNKTGQVKDALDAQKRLADVTKSIR